MNDYFRSRIVESRHKIWSTLDTQRATYALEELVNDEPIQAFRLVNPKTGTDFPLSFHLGFLGLECIYNSVDSISRKSKTADNYYRGKLELRLYTRNGNIIFEVEDNGVGISSASQQYLGEDKIDSDKKQRPIEGINGGEGNFLKIAKTLVERLGGKFEFKPNDSGGVTFSYSIPIVVQNSTSN